MKELQKFEVTEIVNILNNGGIIATPTDTIYGFSCLATDELAVSKLCSIKNCDDAKLYIILVSKNFNLDNIANITPKQLEFVRKNVPNPITMIVNKNPNIKLTQNFHLPTIAIRIPDDNYLQAILDKVGFMISTSCNIHGEKPVINYSEIVAKFPELDAVVVDTISKTNKSSTIIDLTTDTYKVIRQGDYIPKL